MEQQKQKNEELQKKLQETAALQDPWDRFAASCEGISLNVLLFSRFLRNHLNHILRHDVSFWKAQTPSSLFSTYIMCYQLVKWLLLWQEEVAKKREETEDLQKKLQEASAMQAGFLPLIPAVDTITFYRVVSDLPL